MENSQSINSTLKTKSDNSKLEISGRDLDGENFRNISTVILEPGALGRRGMELKAQSRLQIYDTRASE